MDAKTLVLLVLLNLLLALMFSTGPSTPRPLSDTRTLRAGDTVTVEVAFPGRAVITVRDTVAEVHPAGFSLTHKRGHAYHVLPHDPQFARVYLTDRAPAV